MFEALQDTVSFFIIISVIIIPLEFCFNQDKKTIFRKEWGTDFLFYLGQALLWNSFTLYILETVFSYFQWNWLKGFQESIKLQPLWLQIIEVILLCDFFIYWGHRLQHQFSFLWRFHLVHHTAETVDYLAAFREHPLDNIYTRGLETLPAILLGFDLNLLAGFITFRGLWALFIHSNVKLRLGFLEMILGSPHIHHWHHELHKGGSCNYANLSPLMDILFGTFYCPKEPATEYGIFEKLNRTYIGQLLSPFRF